MKTNDEILEGLSRCTITEDADLDVKENFYYAYTDVIKAMNAVIEPNTVTEGEIEQAADEYMESSATLRDILPRRVFKLGAKWALQQTQAAGVREPFNKEAIELVKKHIPNDALAKEYILESLQQTQAVGASEDELIKFIQWYNDLSPYLQGFYRNPKDRVKRYLELLNQKK